MIKPVFFDIETERYDNWTEHIQAPAYPTYKPETRAKKQAEYFDRYNPETGLTTAKVVRVGYKHGSEYKETSNLVDWVSELEATEAPTLFSINTTDKLRQCAWTLMLLENAPRAATIPYLFWDPSISTPNIVNLYSLSGAKQNDIPIDLWIKLCTGVDHTYTECSLREKVDIIKAIAEKMKVL